MFWGFFFSFSLLKLHCISVGLIQFQQQSFSLFIILMFPDVEDTHLAMEWALTAFEICQLF